MRRSKIPIEKVQEAFNAAIKRRDRRCMVRDYELCCGGLECSHFFTVGANQSIRFYPCNAYAQCQRHHFNHHNKQHGFYGEWMKGNHNAEYEYMLQARHRFIRYTDELKAEIIRLCNEDRLEELKTLIEKELGK
jgi:hypothetical protein